MLSKDKVYVGKMGASKFLFKIDQSYNNNEYVTTKAVRLDTEINNESVIIFNHESDIVLSLFDDPVREARDREIELFNEATSLYDKFYNETGLRM